MYKLGWGYDSKNAKSPRGGNYLEISQLRKLFATLFEFADKGFGVVMDDLVGADIASLSKAFPADVAIVRPFACVTAFMGLFV